MSRSPHKPIPYGRQTIDDSDIDAVRQALNRDWLTQGPAVEAFESEIENVTTARHVTAVSSATAGLHLAYKGLGLAENETVWASPITFVSTANAARLCGANVDLVDVDVSTGNMCPQKLEDKLKHSSRKGELPALVVPVHLGGSSCDMKAIRDACNRYEVKVVEDASHALGGSYESQPVGSCKFSDAAVFSFHPVKMITTGEGGCVATNKDTLSKLVKKLRSHGITKTDTEFSSNSDGGWYYEQQDLGLNYRITDIQASLGLSQIKRLKAFVEARNQIAIWYHQFLPSEAIPVKPIAGTRSSYHLFMIQLPTTNIRREVYDYLHDHEIRAQVHYIPVHYHPYYQNLGLTRGDFPGAEEFYSRVLSLPIFPELTKDEVKLVCTKVAEALGS
ncbi:MAG TPA: UDP-4-amino-4,6-dideoxy-N-acetyl-beta-L-altrosamine transaminase [Gammaproteobacteria bacterium]|nr:UDP-4-amino-4,6-dideoxy-N-acetyl-beta-L-altrosamine transaminase [Gammaproteobacteria bacterium]